MEIDMIFTAMSWIAALFFVLGSEVIINSEED
jgi:hypothetical protein